jgi:hypothetical protein
MDPFPSSVFHGFRVGPPCGCAARARGYTPPPLGAETAYDAAANIEQGMTKAADFSIDYSLLNIRYSPCRCRSGPAGRTDL